MGKISLYANTVRYLAPEQIWYQIVRRLGIGCPLLKGYRPILNINAVNPLPALKDLDYDGEFLARFSAEALMHNEVTLLHTTEQMDLYGTWHFTTRSPLWNHNLHYFEYLFALAERYEESREPEYFDKLKEYIAAWIKSNPQGSENDAWECYPIALRLPIWIDIYSIFKAEISQNTAFEERLLRSLFEQYVFLLDHLEKHLLANHLFEDLKALVIAATFFGDETVQRKATEELVQQCEEQILPDGMHYERSPMYQKILLEDLLRVEAALEHDGKANAAIRQYIGKMLGAAYSLEEGLERLPLFNDCGSNVAKSLTALCNAAENRFGIRPMGRAQMPDGGYYIFKQGDWKLIVDAGQPGPAYSPGHAHCEAMSFELFKSGIPVIVNCGTYAYQCSQRSYFKSTAAHNTVQTAKTEQSECWGNFRMARRARIRSVKCEEHSITMCMADYKGHVLKRTIQIRPEEINVLDETGGEEMGSYLHFANEAETGRLTVHSGSAAQFTAPYAEEFGLQRDIPAVKMIGIGTVRYTVKL